MDGLPSISGVSEGVERQAGVGYTAGPGKNKLQYSDRETHSPVRSPSGSGTEAPYNSNKNRSHMQFLPPSASDLDDAEDGGSLTRQLAETATGVREMSKQLGRAKVKSNIQSILVVTKARDNRLIKLTREVAIYLMKMKRSANGGRGMIV